SAMPSLPVSPLTIVQDLTTMMMHTAHPELLAAQLAHFLLNMECVRTAAVSIGRQADGFVVESSDEYDRRRLVVNAERAVAIDVEPVESIQARATLNAIRLLVARLRDIERSRTDGEEHLTLWPIDDVTIENGQAIVTGQMRDVMATAKKIANSNVSVLITGES